MAKYRSVMKNPDFIVVLLAVTFIVAMLAIAYQTYLYNVLVAKLYNCSCCVDEVPGQGFSKKYFDFNFTINKNK